MRRWSFVFAVTGIFILLILFSLPPKEIKNLDGLEINTKVSISGEVTSERTFGDFRIFEVNGITVTCDCDRSYLNKEVEILGIVSEYEGEKQISVLEISISD